MALYLAGSGEGEMALQSLVDPYKVPLRYQKQISDLMEPGFDPESMVPVVEEKGLFPTIRRLFSNPVFLGGIILAGLYPVGRKGIMRYLENAKNYSHMPWFHQLRSANQIFRDKAGQLTKAGRMLMDTSFEIEREIGKHGTMLQEAVTKYEKATGRALDKATAVKINLWLEKPWESMNPEWKRVRDLSGRSNVGVMKFNLTREEKLVADAFDALRRGEYERTLKPLHGGQMKQFRGELRNRGIVTGNLPSPERMDTYVPHYLHTRPGPIRDEVTKLLREGRIDEAVALSNPRAPATQLTYEQYKRGQLSPKVAKSVRAREMWMLPTPEHLKLVERYLKPGSVAAVEEALLKGRRFASKRPLMVAEYSLDGRQTWMAYADSMARFRVLHVKEAGKALSRYEALRQEGDVVMGQNKILGKYLTDVHLPLLQGRLSEAQLWRMQAWEQKKMQWVEMLQTNKFFQKGPAKELANKLTNSLMTGALSSQVSRDAAITGYLYTSTLGANFGSALTNLMQTFLTTVPSLGFVNTAEGTLNAMKKMGKYFSQRGEGVAHRVAFEKAFPEFIESGLHTAGETSLARILDHSWRDVSGRLSGSRVWTKTQAALLRPFTLAETTNRVVAFESAMAASKAGGLSKAQSAEVARQVVAETQFLTGPLMQPQYFLTSKTLGRPIFRQFLQFPLGLAGYLGSAVGRGDLGTLGRFAATSAAGVQLAREAGMDWRHAFGMGALPIQKEGLLGVLPTPPIASLGEALLSPFTGDEYAGRKALPLLVPGGVATARATTAFAPGVAEKLGKTYVDYNRPNEEGLLPMYKPNGQLIGHFSKTQIMLQGLGVRPASLGEEQSAIKYLMKQRDIIRDMRRRATESYMKNQMGEFSKLSEEWKRMFGTPFMLKRSDIKAWRDRKDMTRMEVLYRQMPAELKPQFRQAVYGSMVENQPTYLGG
jgi:hypothetical protein